MKILMILLQSLEKSGVLIDAVSETEKHQIKKKEGDFSVCY